MPIVIIHGWSDTSDSFVSLRDYLAEELDQKPVVLHLADWISMDDGVSIEDVAAAMDKAWTSLGLPKTARSVDVVVHSTGALVLRAWLRRRRFTRANCPVHRVGMLAPANFGSPLAHQGRSIGGRIAKGWNNWFETGTHVLKALEMGSPYTWKLAEDDLLGANPLWGPGGILATVLVGDTGYSGIRSFVNRDGGDGTVLISTAALDCARVTLDYSQNPLHPSATVHAPPRMTALGIVAGANHTTVHTDEDGRKLLVKALTVTDDTFERWHKHLAVANRQTRFAMQNTVVRVRDDLGNRVDDYLIEFTRGRDQSGVSLAAFQKKVLSDVHTYKDDPSYRSLVLDCEAFDTWLGQRDALHVSITAHPVFIQPQAGQPAERKVGYRTLNQEDIGEIVVPYESLPNIVFPHRTLLVDIVLHREQAPEVFRWRQP
jgi:pimeloyl-ACP methyl ester carboxylesterase